MAQPVLNTVFTAIDRMTKPIKAMTRSVLMSGDRMSRSVDRVNRKFARTEHLMQSIASKSLFVGLAIATPLYLAVKEAVKFEKAMGNIATLVDTDKYSIKSMGDELLAFANNTPVPLEDLTESMYQILSSGKDVEESMKMLGVSSKLSVTGLSSSKEAVLLLANAQKKFGSETMNLDEIANVFFKTVAVGLNDVSKLQEGFGAMAAVSNLAGIGFEDVMAAVAAFTVGGASASEAMTRIESSLVSVMKPNDKMIVVMRTLRAEFPKMEKGVKGMTKYFGNYQKTMENIVRVGKSKGWNVAQVFGRKEGMIAVEDILGSTSADYIKNIERMTNGIDELDVAFQKQREVLSSVLIESENQLRGMGVIIGTALIPSIRETLEYLKPLVAKFTEWVDNNPSMLRQIVINVAVFALMTFALSGVATALNVVIGVVKIFELTWLALSTVILGNPLGWILVIIAVVVWMIYRLIKTVDLLGRHWDDLAGISFPFLLAIPVIGEVILLLMSFYKHWDSIKKAFRSEGIIGGIKKIGAVIYDAIYYPLQKSLEILGKIPGFDWAINAGNDIKNFRENALGLYDQKVAYLETNKNPYTNVLSGLNINYPLINTEKTILDSTIEKTEQIRTQTEKQEDREITINVKDSLGIVQSILSDSTGIKIWPIIGEI